MTAPAGSISLAQEHLRTMLADCDAFRTWAGAADQAEALERIHHEGLPAPANHADVFTLAELQAYRPYAVVYTGEENGFSRTLDAAGGDFSFASSGQLKLRLYQDAPESCGDEPSSDANLQFKNAIGQILDDLCELAGQPGYLAFNQITLDNGPYWAHPNSAPTEGVWQGVEIGIQWSS